MGGVGGREGAMQCCLCSLEKGVFSQPMSVSGSVVSNRIKANISHVPLQPLFQLETNAVPAPPPVRDYDKPAKGSKEPKNMS